MVGRGEALEVRPQRRLAEHQPNARRCPGAPVAGQFVAQRHQAGGAGEPQERRRRPLTQAAKILTEPGLDRPQAAPVQALDEPADEAKGILEGEPGIALTPLRDARVPNMPAGDPQGAGSARPSRQSTRWEDGVEQRQTKRRQDRRGSEIGISIRSRIAASPINCRGVWSPRSSPGRSGAPSISGNLVRSSARVAATPGSAKARARSSVSSGDWRCSEPPRWSRQTVQR